MRFLQANVRYKAKYPLIIMFALLLNFAVFTLIQRLTTNTDEPLTRLIPLDSVNFIRLEQEAKTPKNIKDDKRPEPPAEQEPPLLEISNPKVDKPKTEQTQLNIPNVDIPITLSGLPWPGNAIKSSPAQSIPVDATITVDNDLVPTLKIPPTYPPRALRRKIEGIVTVEFTVTTTGAVKSPVVIRAKPPGVFDNAVLRAIIKWKFNPDRVNGKAVEKRVRQNVKFKLQ